MGRLRIGVGRSHGAMRGRGACPRGHGSTAGRDGTRGRRGARGVARAGRESPLRGDGELDEAADAKVQLLPHDEHHDVHHIVALSDQVEGARAEEPLG